MEEFHQQKQSLLFVYVRPSYLHFAENEFLKKILLVITLPGPAENPK